MFCSKEFIDANEISKNVSFSIELVGRYENYERSEWWVNLEKDIFIVSGGWAMVLPSGTPFKFKGELNATKEEVEDEIRTRGILRACDVSELDFQNKLEEEEDEDEE